MLCSHNLTADVVVEFDASSGGTPAAAQPAWQWQSGAGIEMQDVNGVLMADWSKDDPQTQYCNYISPASEGLMKRNAGQYGIEFRARPIGDVPNLGNSHYANIALIWADDQNAYNLTLDLDSDDKGPQTAGAIRSGFNSMSAVVSNVDWKEARTIFIGYRGDDDEFDIYIDGKKRETVRAHDIARDPIPTLRNRVSFGDQTSGQPAPDAVDPPAEWHFVRIHDSAKLPPKDAKRKIPAPAPAPAPSQTGTVNDRNMIWLYGGICKSEAETVALIEKCKSNGIGALLPSLSAGGDVLWKTDKANYAAENKQQFDAGFDGLESLVRNAHAAGMKVVPSVAVCPGGRVLEEHPEWETRDRNGKPSRDTAGMAAVSLAYKDARAAKIALLMDLVNGYAVDGVLVDYCRYPENSKTEEQKFGFYGYDQPLIDTCINVYGFDPRTAPLKSAEWNVFNAMRAETVNAFVREFRDAAKAARPEIRIAGFGDSVPEEDAESCGRDYAAWAQRGYIDDLFIATYTEKIDQMKSVVEHVRGAVGDKVVLYTALTSFQGFLKTNDEMKQAGEQQLAGGANGLWIYREDFLNQLNLWDGAKQANDLLAGGAE